MSHHRYIFFAQDPSCTWVPFLRVFFRYLEGFVKERVKGTSFS